MPDYFVVIVEGPGAGREFQLSGASLIAGRDPATALPLDDPEASRQHASISAQEGGAVVEDLGSTNGTFVGEERLTEARAIQPGDRIRIGTTVIELREGTASGDRPAAPAPEEPAATSPPPPPGGAPPPPEPAGAPPAAEQPGAPPPPPEQPPAGPPAPPAAPGEVAPGGAYPIDVEAAYGDGSIPRWAPLVQWWLLVIPSMIAFFFVAIVAFFAIFAAWFAVLFTRNWPRGLFDFVAGTGRWGVRLSAYYFLLTSRYPPFSLGEEPDYPVRARFDYPARGIARWRPLVQWFLAIPHFIVLYVLGLVASVCAIAAGFAILFTGRYPRGLYDIVVGYVRWQTRVNAYYYFMTDRYPPFSLAE
jgi:hypothetical protein